jgi:hypothetical protein
MLYRISLAKNQLTVERKAQGKFRKASSKQDGGVSHYFLFQITAVYVDALLGITTGIDQAI